MPSKQKNKNYKEAIKNKINIYVSRLEREKGPEEGETEMAYLYPFHRMQTDPYFALSSFSLSLQLFISLICDLSVKHSSVLGLDMRP